MRMSTTPSSLSFSHCLFYFLPPSLSPSLLCAWLFNSLASSSVAWRLASLESTEAGAARALQSKVWNEHVTSAHSINYKASPDSKKMIEMYPHPFLRGSAAFIERRAIDHSLLRRLSTKMGVGEEDKCSQVPQVQRKNLGCHLFIEEVNYQSLP